MSNRKRVQWVVSLTLLMNVGLPLLLPLGLIAGSITISHALTWQDVLDVLKRKRSQGGTRGEFCLVNPGQIGEEQLPQIWHTHPIFLWQGKAQQITVSSHENNQRLWSQNLTVTDQQATFTGQPLQPGQIYDWSLTGISDPAYASFQVLTPTRYNRVTAELKALEQRLKQARASQETIALERSHFFIQQQLWSDALQEMYAVPQPSATLRQLQATFRRDFCYTQPVSSSR